MKYFILLVDGAADDKISELGGKTILQAAKMDTANHLANLGEVGSVLTVRKGVTPASDSANLAILGYDPIKYLTGRAAFEAIGMGIKMEKGDVAFRASSITLIDSKTERPADENSKTAYEDLLIGDYSASQISTAETRKLVEKISEKLGNGDIAFYPGVSYRHCSIIKSTNRYNLIPPHDVAGKRVGDVVPKKFSGDRNCEETAYELLNLQKASYELMRGHIVNKERLEKGLNPANTLWFWGAGSKPELESFEEKYGLSACIISAVDLIKGIGISAGMEVVNVEGATGDINTNYEGKRFAAISAFERGKDLVYLHLEAPDECGHQGDVEGKIRSLEIIDEKILKPVFEYLEDEEKEFKIMVLPDHKTPVKLKVHTEGAVPFVIYDSRMERAVDKSRCFDEISAENGTVIENGFEIMDYFLKI